MRILRGKSEIFEGKMRTRSSIIYQDRQTRRYRKAGNFSNDNILILILVKQPEMCNV